MKSESWNSAASAARRVGSTVEFHPSIGSTNDRAWQLLRAGVEGTAVVADLQTAGRGRHGRTWASPPGVSLMVSTGIQADLPATDAWQLAGASGLALLQACRQAVPAPAADGLGLKWPNDLVDEEGLKLAGLLIETSIDGEQVRQAVVGAGVNVNWRRDDMQPEIAGNATSLSELRGARVDRVTLLSDYLAALEAEIQSVEAGHSPVERYAAASWLDGREVEVLVGDRIVTGTVSGIGEGGALLVETDGGLATLGHGEVLRVGVRKASGVPA
jgi:BirA family biotin operon repressor/biotin-[acetyl-CoA-carboxylase] ligase